MRSESYPSEERRKGSRRESDTVCALHDYHSDRIQEVLDAVKDVKSIVTQQQVQCATQCQKVADHDRRIVGLESDVASLKKSVWIAVGILSFAQVVGVPLLFLILKQALEGA